MTLRILITGGSGYIAKQLRTEFKSNGYEVIFCSHNQAEAQKGVFYNTIHNNPYIDIVEKTQPDVVVHTAWINSLDICETNKDLAYEVNVKWSQNLVEAIKLVDKSTKLVFISSDYVFDGNRGRYTEQCERNPLTYYGKNKLEVEDYIVESGIKHLIVRTANVYDHGGNFFNFLYSNLSKNRVVEVFYDTFFSPTYMRFFTDSIIQLISRNIEGVIHLAGEERVSRYIFAFKLASIMGVDETKIVPISKPERMLIAKDVSLDSSYSRKLISNYSPSIEKSFQFLLGRIVYPYFTYYDKRGGMRGIVQDRQKWEEINYVEAVQWAIRGRHYHKDTYEGFFIIDGKILVETRKLESGKIESFLVEKGDIFFIEPNVVHTFHMLKNSKWINFLSKSMKVGEKDFHLE